MDTKHLQRLPIMALAMTALLTGVWTGLLRLGWDIAPLRPGFAVHHGPLMVSGFLGTLIGMERAVALSRRWAYSGPVLTGLGTLALIAGSPGTVGAVFMALGSGVMVAVFATIIRRQPALYTAMMGLGAFTWLLGNALWLMSWPLFMVAPWWIGFLTLTIAGERLELSRLLQPSRRSLAAFLVAAGLFCAGIILNTMAIDIGARLSGLGLVLLALWLWHNDLARRTVWNSGLTRFIAICLLSGYIWLGIGGALGLRFGPVAAGPYYDAVLHTLFLGFVVAMIFGHAPIIFPAVLGVAVPFRRVFYTHLALLHLSLILRLVGDLAVWWPGRQWGGLLNGLALLMFLANTGLAVSMPSRKRAVEDGH